MVIVSRGRCVKGTCVSRMCQGDGVVVTPLPLCQDCVCQGDGVIVIPYALEIIPLFMPVNRSICLMERWYSSLSCLR